MAATTPYQKRQTGDSKYTRKNDTRIFTQLEANTTYFNARITRGQPEENQIWGKEASVRKVDVICLRCNKNEIRL